MRCGFLLSVSFEALRNHLLVDGDGVIFFQGSLVTGEPIVTAADGKRSRRRAWRLIFCPGMIVVRIEESHNLIIHHWKRQVKESDVFKRCSRAKTMTMLHAWRTR